MALENNTIYLDAGVLFSAAWYTLLKIAHSDKTTSYNLVTSAGILTIALSV